MKKSIFLAIVITLLFSLGVNANELTFQPVGGGKFIYCNNPEGIKDDFLLNGEAMRYIMNNKDLAPDNYYVYVSHFNYTGNGKRGDDIEIDVELFAKEDTEIIIHKAFFDTVENHSYYENGEKKCRETDWGMIQVCCDMLDIPLCELRGEDIYYPRGYKTETVQLSKGKRLWLSEFIENYKSVIYGKGVHLQALIEVRSGKVDLNVAALKTAEAVGQRGYLQNIGSFGEYRWDYTLKGIAESLPEVKADVNYVITDETKDKENIPVHLKNQYIEEGHTVTNWYTHLNPQNDIWTKKTAAESSMLPLYYKDDSKLDFYGTDVSDDKKNNVWVFDTKHSAMRKYDPSLLTSGENEYIPNFMLSTESDNHNYACNLGNYGVLTTYKMTIKNETKKTKYCSLVLTASGESIAYKTVDGVKSCGYIKDFADEKITDNMLSHEIPPNSTEEFEFTIILPVNYNGGIKNELVITDENIQTADFSKKEAETEKKCKEQGYSPIENIYDKNVLNFISKMPYETTSKIKSRGYEILRGKGSYIVRWCGFDGAPMWYSNLWENTDDIYLLDNEFNIIKDFNLPSPVCDASFFEGYYYLKTVNDGMFKSDDGVKWTETNEKMPEYVPFYDLDNASEWAVNELTKGWDDGLYLNPQGDSYNFKDGITREDFCELIYSLIKKVSENTEKLYDITFDDTSNEKIKHLASIGIINGFGDGTFRPDEKLTREQAAVILQRLSKYVLKDSSTIVKNDNEKIKFTDSDAISLWAEDGVNFVYKAGIMIGVSENTFYPKGPYSREQSAVTIERLYRNLDI